MKVMSLDIAGHCILWGVKAFKQVYVCWCPAISILFLSKNMILPRKELSLILATL